MIRSIAVACFSLVVASAGNNTRPDSSADGMITQVAYGWGPGGTL